MKKMFYTYWYVPVFIAVSLFVIFFTNLTSVFADSHPTVLSIELLNDNPTQDQELVFEITFSEEISGLDGGDFQVATTGDIVGESIVSIDVADVVPGSVGTTVYTGTGLDDAIFSGEFNSTADGCSMILGVDSLAPGNGLDNDTFIYGFQPGQGECDISDAPYGGDGPPTSVEITPGVAQYLGGGVYITFENGTGHTALVMEGLVNSWVADLVAGSGGAVYHVTVDRGTGSGTLHLAFLDDDTVVDVDENPVGGIGLSNGDFTTADAYIIPSMLGAGTEEDPYQITDCEQLQSMNEDVSAYYQLQNDIDCADTVNWNAGEGFIPVGDEGDPFTGSLHGNGYTISDLFIARDANEQGLFGFIGETGEVADLYLVGFDISVPSSEFGYHIGSLAGKSYGTISSISVQGASVSAAGPVGGLIGTAGAGNISDIEVEDVTVIASSSNAGGAVGYVFPEGENTTITNMYVYSSTVQGAFYVGGVIGLASVDDENPFGYEADMLQIVNSFADDVSVSAEEGFAGGFIGLLGRGQITQSYATGSISETVEEGSGYGGFTGGVVLGGVIEDSFSVANVSGTDMVGGFAGLVGQYGGLPPGGGYINRVYSTGAVTGNTNVGGLVGLESNNDGEILNSYWDIETSGQLTSSAGTGKTTAEMQNIATYIGWDIIGVDAEFDSLYPILWTEENSDATWIIFRTESEPEPTPTRRSSSSSTSQSRALAKQVFADHYNQSETPALCPTNQIITQNLRAPSRNGVYNSYAGGIVLEIHILQAHLNRLGFNSGPVDGIAGPLTDGAIKRMQTFLGTTPDGYVGPLTRGLLNTSCSSQGLQTN